MTHGTQDDELQEMHDTAAAARAMEIALSTLRRECAAQATQLQGIIVDVRWNRGVC